MINLTLTEAEFIAEILEQQPEYSKWNHKGISTDEFRKKLLEQINVESVNTAS